MGITQSTAPTHEPITLAEAKAWLRESEPYEEDRIQSLIGAARDYVERVTGRQLVTATWQLTMPTLSGVIEPPHPPLAGVTSITYNDSSGDSQTVASSVYSVFTDTEPGRIVEAPGQSWPSDVRGEEEDVIVTYPAGYGDAAAVPDILKTAVLTLISHWFDLRQPVVIGTITAEVPKNFDMLIGAYRAKDFQ